MVQYVSIISTHQARIRCLLSRLLSTDKVTKVQRFQNGSVFSYSATRAAHSNPFGFAARWSGSWIFHGSNADVKREGGRISIFRENNIDPYEFLGEKKSKWHSTNRINKT